MTEKIAMTVQKTEGEDGNEKEWETPEKAQEPAEPVIIKEGDGDSEIPAIDPEEDALNASETIRDMAVGLAVCAVVLAAVGCIFVRDAAYRFALGVLLGAGVAGVMLRHLYVTIDRALDMDQEHASKYMKKSAVLRLLMAGAALAAGAYFTQVFHVFGVLAGVLCLKFTAYLQPLTHKVIKFLSKGR
ncbi:MAG: ATP synthase subunit I [Lachnospiraceae bacterium]|nr:ATP synthase subunit I [Lachnospiraceae bacterium]